MLGIGQVVTDPARPRHGRAQADLLLWKHCRMTFVAQDVAFFGRGVREQKCLLSPGARLGPALEEGDHPSRDFSFAPSRRPQDPRRIHHGVTVQHTEPGRARGFIGDQTHRRFLKLEYNLGL